MTPLRATFLAGVLACRWRVDRATSLYSVDPFGSAP